MASLKTVGVIGAGTMGSGIAQVCALTGLPVAMIDVDAAAIARGRNAISANVDRLDVVLAVMEIFYRDFNDPKYRPALMLKEMVAARYLGRKTGRGFYTYEAR